jgi:hypothetical protein
LEELQKACEKTRGMFGIEINVEWRVPPDTGKGDNLKEGELK